MTGDGRDWLRAIGVLVESIAWSALETGSVPEWRPGSVAARHLLMFHGNLHLGQLMALDAVAVLLTDHAVTRVRHQRELRDEIQDGSRAARDAFSSGLLEGLDQRNRG